MPNTYSQIYLQVVFSVKDRNSLIHDDFREKIEKYIAGIINHRGQKLLSIFCMPDHTHLLISIQPNVAISDIIRDVKAGATKYINENNWIKGRFAWQEGFGAFSYSQSQIDKVAKYIVNQKVHHSIKSFKEEYIELLQKFEIDFNEKYIFKFADIGDAPNGA